MLQFYHIKIKKTVILYYHWLLLKSIYHLIVVSSGSLFSIILYSISRLIILEAGTYNVQLSKSTDHY